MQVISAVAEFERDLLIERTHSGLVRAKLSGKKFGRPKSLTVEQQKMVLSKIKEGLTISSIARHYKTSRQTIIRVREKALLFD